MDDKKAKKEKGMTLREATEVARAMKPIVCDGIEYIRIVEAGYSYDESGTQKPYVTLLDKSLRSVRRTVPSQIEIRKEDCDGDKSGSKAQDGQR